MTPMTARWRSTRALAALAISLALLAGSFGTTLGAVANVGFGGGWVTGNSDVTGATPIKVSPGKVAGFYLWAKNNDSANLSSFFLTATTAAPVVGAFWSHTPSGPWTACDTSNGLNCTFGAFNSGASLYVLAAFTAQSTASTTNCLTDPNRKTEPSIKAGFDPTSAAAHACVDFQWASNSGYVPGKNRSRGDAYHWFDAVNTNTGADDASQFPFCDLSALANCDPSLLTISDTQSLGRTNAQWTKVLAPGGFDSVHGTTGIGVADNVNFPCATTTGLGACATSFLAQWSSVDVNSGQEFPGDWIVVDIGVYGVSASKINTVYHFYQDSLNAWQVETLGRCADANGPATTSSPACFWVVSLKGNSSQVTIWTHHNGKFNMG